MTDRPMSPETLAWGLDVEFTDATTWARWPRRSGPTGPACCGSRRRRTHAGDHRPGSGVRARARGRGARVAADNTAATPALTRLFEFGADLVVHSASKYLNGHGDVLAGAVLTARRDPFWERIRSWRPNAGAMPGPFEAWLL